MQPLELPCDGAFLGKVYFLSGPAPTDPVKIGFTGGKVEDRIASLQTGHPTKLSTLLVIEGGMDLEARLHRAFKEFHLFGEWFAKSPALLGAIAALKAAPRVSPPPYSQAAPDEPKKLFDRNAYQRELMRKRRAAAKLNRPT